MALDITQQLLHDGSKFCYTIDSNSYQKTHLKVVSTTCVFHKLTATVNSIRSQFM